MKLERTLCFLIITSLLIFSDMAPAFGNVCRSKTDSQQTIPDLSSFSPNEDYKKAIELFGYAAMQLFRYSAIPPQDTTEYCEPPPFTSSAENYCMTPECFKEAAEILYKLDETEDPCTDFNQFACGGWLKRYTIPENEAFVSTLSQERDDFHLKLKDLLDRKLDGSEPLFIKMIKDFYDTCMDVETIGSASSKPLKEVLKKLGGWPMMEGTKWNESKFDWIQSLISFKELGFDHNILLNLSVSADEKNSRVNKIHLSNANVPRLQNSGDRILYSEIIVDSTKLLAAGNDDEKPDKLADRGDIVEVINFVGHLKTFGTSYSGPEETTDVKISDTVDESQEMVPQPCLLEEADEKEKEADEEETDDEKTKVKDSYTVKELQEKIPQIPWLTYFNGLLNDEIDENEKLVIKDLADIKRFVKLMSLIKKRMVANYMLWTVVLQSMPFLSKEWRDLHRRYNSLMGNEIKEKSRLEQCLGHFQNEDLSLALGSYYVRHYLDEESEELLSKIETYVQTELEKILQETDWMDEMTKKHSIDKVKAINFYISYPKELLNKAAVMEIYKNLMIDDESFYKNGMKLKKWNTDKALSLLRKLNTEKDWTSHITINEVNTFYNFLENSIDIPMGLLKGIYFKKERPYYLNFGALGSAIGHEIAHGFDSQNRRRDKDGNKVNWRNEATDEIFKNKLQCMVNQYSSYSIENGMKVNGCLTKDENFADNGGLIAAYRAYQSWAKDNGPDKFLPGLKYSQNQMFWISAAHAWCGKINPNNLKEALTESTYSPFKFRVIGPMSNLEEFSKEFNCSPDSPMNRKNKCQVW
nr:venom protein [Lampona murina]